MKKGGCLDKNTQIIKNVNPKAGIILNSNKLSRISKNFTEIYLPFCNSVGCLVHLGDTLITDREIPLILIANESGHDSD